MKLKEYFTKNGISLHKFAKLIGVSNSTLYNIIDGKNDVRLSIAIKIEDLTNKAVTARDLLPANPKYKS